MSRILIIEDDKEISEIERDYLELDGFEADIANNGITGLEKALGGEYDLVLLDLMLPGMDGFSICKRLSIILQAFFCIRHSFCSAEKTSFFKVVHSLKSFREFFQNFLFSLFAHLFPFLFIHG